MSQIIPILFFPFAIMVGHPYLALIPAAIFSIFYFKIKNSLIGITAILWLLYSIYETLMFLRITCSGECNIRVDLLLIVPILLIMTIKSLIKIFKRNPK